MHVAFGVPGFRQMSSVNSFESSHSSSSKHSIGSCKQSELTVPGLRQVSNVCGLKSLHSSSELQVVATDSTQSINKFLAS